MKRRDVLRTGLAGAGLLALPMAAMAQDKYPSMPIKLVVPFAPGGPTDVFGRKFAERATRLLGQQMIVDNKAGAGGTLGSALVASAKPDGYTILFGSSSTHVTGPLLLEKPSYHPVKDFITIIIGVAPLILAVNPAVPAKTLQEFVALLKANPGKYAYASSGQGSIDHLAGELLKLKAGGLESVHVPYRGNGPALQDVIAGQVQYFHGTFSTMLPHHQAGKLRILAVFADKRSPAAPDIPTAKEAGFPDVLANTVNVLALPKDTPDAVVDTVKKAAHTIMSDTAFQKELEALSIEAVTDSEPATAATFFSGELARWEPIIRATGAKLE
jgi:tripartite-type tricarboxylate transporter receptor subunit TctC